MKTNPKPSVQNTDVNNVIATNILPPQALDLKMPDDQNALTSLTTKF